MTVTNNGRTPPGGADQLRQWCWLAGTDRAHPPSGTSSWDKWHDWCQARLPAVAPLGGGSAPVGRARDGPSEASVRRWVRGRSRPLPRTRSLAAQPRALDPGGASGTTGAVLDPIFALRTHPARPRALGVGLVHRRGHRCRQPSTSPTATGTPRAAQLDFAWTTAQIELRELRTSSEGRRCTKLANDLFFSDAQLGRQRRLRKNAGSRSLLWRVDVSGDRPIVPHDRSTDGLPRWRTAQGTPVTAPPRMTIDLVVLNTPPSYFQTLTGASAPRCGPRRAGLIDQPGASSSARKELVTPSWACSGHGPGARRL